MWCTYAFCAECHGNHYNIAVAICDLISQLSPELKAAIYDIKTPHAIDKNDSSPPIPPYTERTTKCQVCAKEIPDNKINRHLAISHHQHLPSKQSTS